MSGGKDVIQQVGRNSKVTSPITLTSKEIKAAIAEARNSPALLSPPRSEDESKICLVLDLDETLVHSVFQPVPNADMVIPVEVGGQQFQVNVLKRPGVDKFLSVVGELYECIIWTASLSIYADPVSEQLDPHHTIIKARLFREHCVFMKQTYVKDLLRLGRPINRVAIIDNSPLAYMLQPDNAIPIGSWFDDPNDTELLDMIPFLKKFAKIDDVYKVLKKRK